MTEPHILIGKTITAVELTDDQEAIRFTLADGSQIVALCDGDCCSHTWIEEVLNPEFAIGKPVLKAEDIELPTEFLTPTKTENDEEEMAYYSFLIETANGRCTIAYRNSSNGYYGGNLSWPDEYYHDCVFNNYNKKVPEFNWKPVA